MNTGIPPILVVGTRSRLAFKFTPSTIRMHIPDRTVGSYLLLDHQHPVYIGRSDTCLGTRLSGHPFLGRATHVAWEVATSASRAYQSEAFWYHELLASGSVLNLIHPASPAGSLQQCPYCDRGGAERRALLAALSAPTARPAQAA